MYGNVLWFGGEHTTLRILREASTHSLESLPILPRRNTRGPIVSPVGEGWAPRNETWADVHASWGSDLLLLRRI